METGREASAAIRIRPLEREDLKFVHGMDSGSPMVSRPASVRLSRRTSPDSWLATSIVPSAFIQKSRGKSPGTLKTPARSRRRSGRMLKKASELWPRLEMTIWPLYSRMAATPLKPS